ncbi:MAG: helix-turn-helix domain-containing protein, partial [Terriglobia bacterium]
MIANEREYRITKAAALTQESLAQKLGLKRQQIQCYEATEYASASLATICQIAQAIESTVSGGWNFLRARLEVPAPAGRNVYRLRWRRSLKLRQERNVTDVAPNGAKEQQYTPSYKHCAPNGA